MIVKDLLLKTIDRLPKLFH